MSKLKTNTLNTNINKIQFLTDIDKDSYALFGLDNTFCIFNSINNILYIIYTNINYSIISYNLIQNKKINEIKNAHNEDITNFRHYLDNNNKIDLILSLSSVDNNIKIWNTNNWLCIINIKNINNDGILKSSCFLYDNNQIYIITSNSNTNNYAILEPIKIFDLNGNKIKEIKDSNDDTIFIDTYFNNNYIITGNNGYIKSYNYNENNIYMKYEDYKNYTDHSSIIIQEDGGIIKMIESCGDGNIRIWNFHSGELLKKIKISNGYLYGICLWNKDKIFVGCRDKKIKLVDLKNGIIQKEIEGHNKDVLTIKNIIHPQLGECLISQGKYDSQIKLWIIKK